MKASTHPAHIMCSTLQCCAGLMCAQVLLPCSRGGHSVAGCCHSSTHTLLLHSSVNTRPPSTPAFPGLCVCAAATLLHLLHAKLLDAGTHIKDWHVGCSRQSDSCPKEHTPRVSVVRCLHTDANANANATHHYCSNNAVAPSPLNASGSCICLPKTPQQPGMHMTCRCTPLHTHCQ